MYTSALVALSQQRLLRRQMDVVAHNLANISTPGFKREFLLVQKKHKDVGTGADVAFVAEKAVLNDMAPGALESTSNPLDVAIQGQSFFAIETPQGIGYTRDGTFSIDALGRLVTMAGHPVLSPSYAPISIPPQTSFVTIGSGGMINTSSGLSGQIGLFDFKQPELLKKIESAVYQGSEVPQAPLNPHVVQGVKELSNVQPVVELTHMIDILRNYQYNQHMIDQEDQRQKQSIEKLVPGR